MALWIACALSGCGDDEPTGSFVDPSYADPCTYASCGHGQCSSTSGAPQCVCDPGYVGAACASCATGYHQDARALCVPDRSCADNGAQICGAHGACKDGGGVVACDCDRGYAGARCDVCGSGFVKNEYNECLQVLVVNGVAQTPAPTCRAETCGHHGDCSARDGELLCSCYPNYTGVRCELCAAGFSLKGDRCVMDAPCAAEGPCGACESFVGSNDFPLFPDTCLAAPSYETEDLVMTSMESIGEVWLCGAGSRYGLVSEHVVLEISNLHPAQLAFRNAVSKLSFTIAGGVFNTPGPIQIDVLGDGKHVSTLELMPNVSEPIDLVFEPPVSAVGLKSMRTRNEVALDALVYEMAECR